MQQSVNRARRNFLRGKDVTDAPPLRPPGAVEETMFVECCTACGDCVTGCPQEIVVSGSAGYPEIDFGKGECSFCMSCIEKCTEGALVSEGQHLWRVRIFVQDHCLALRKIICQTCRDFCDVEAIRFPPRFRAVAQPSIDTDACTGCGACVAACPESALEATSYV